MRGIELLGVTRYNKTGMEDQDTIVIQNANPGHLFISEGGTGYCALFIIGITNVTKTSDNGMIERFSVSKNRTDNTITITKTGGSRCTISTVYIKI